MVDKVFRQSAFWIESKAVEQMNTHNTLEMHICVLFAMDTSNISVHRTYAPKMEDKGKCSSMFQIKLNFIKYAICNLCIVCGHILQSSKRRSVFPNALEM